MGSSGSPELGSEQCRKQRQKRRPPIRTSIIIDGPSIGAKSAGGCALTRIGLSGHLTLKWIPGPYLLRASYDPDGCFLRWHGVQSQPRVPGVIPRISSRSVICSMLCTGIRSRLPYCSWATPFFHGQTLFRTPVTTEPRADRPRRPHTPPPDAENGYGYAIHGVFIHGSFSAYGIPFPQPSSRINCIT